MDKKGKIPESDNCRGKGKLFVIGTGPGSLDDLTPRAKDALSSVDVVVGYARYIDLLQGLIRGKEVFQTPMKGEVERCSRALELACAGRRVAVISSGDAGIYAMAGLVLELRDKMPREDKDGDCDIVVIPGMPAFVSAASKLGAPLMHDFASISLSDLLTPWELITRRVELACRGDFVIALYNPRSKGRTTQLPEVVTILRSLKDDRTPVGIVKNSAREDEEVRVVILGDLPGLCETIDMLTVIIIGNSDTFVTARGEMVTPRGYRGV